ncbi:hypothetical protein RhiJN_28829 [Ceratobasidium sp. AG-Ba]|nr:hypothetical protein RhiJN_28829 [Ceratobasidium sp. AG-Ba]
MLFTSSLQPPDLRGSGVLHHLLRRLSKNALKVQTHSVFWSIEQVPSGGMRYAHISDRVGVLSITVVIAFWIRKIQRLMFASTLNGRRAPPIWTLLVMDGLVSRDADATPEADLDSDPLQTPYPPPRDSRLAPSLVVRYSRSLEGHGIVLGDLSVLSLDGTQPLRVL